MKDQTGLFYYPYPQNKRVRMYVRDGYDDIEFRLWNADDSELWNQHGWVPFEAISQAAAMYEGKGFNPHRAYDFEIARALLDEDQD